MEIKPFPYDRFLALSIVTCSYCLCLMVGITLAIFFFFPRVPDVSEPQGRTENLSYSLSPPEFQLDAVVSLNVNNENYVGLSLDRVDLDVNYVKTGEKIGHVDMDQVKFPARTNQTVEIRALITGDDVEDSTIAQALKEIENTERIELRFKGSAIIKVLFYEHKIDIDRKQSFKVPNLSSL
eukprot:gb/GECH01009309.1/.p1 GENE.gb/GECH01009309.1/~~gb/GECH01009309.1/.p1  ORF type:complete len:181 (+),score=22.52 gb/GECH01009309.1/:1-543(+)